MSCTLTSHSALRWAFLQIDWSSIERQACWSICRFLVPDSSFLRLRALWFSIFSTVYCFLRQTTLQWTVFFCQALENQSQHSLSSVERWSLFCDFCSFQGGGRRLRMKLTLFVSQASANFCDGPLNLWKQTQIIIILFAFGPEKKMSCHFSWFVFGAHPICFLYNSVQNASRRQLWSSIFPRQSPKTLSYLKTMNFAQRTITHFIPKDFERKLHWQIFGKVWTFA